MNDEQFRVKIGDVYELKKKHPCGSSTFKVLNNGVDSKIECQGCGHIITIDRLVLRKSIKKVIKTEEKTC